MHGLYVAIVHVSYFLVTHDAGCATFLARFNDSLKKCSILLLFVRIYMLNKYENQDVL